MIFMHMLRFLIDISFYFSFSSVLVASIFKNYLTMGWLLAMAPAVLYLLVAVLRKNYVLSWHRQMDIFTVFWKGYLGFSFVTCLFGVHQELLMYSMPFAIIVACTSILFLRMLRQNPEVYLNQEYQKKNILVFVGIILIAWLCSRKIVLLPIKCMLEFFYMKIFVPVITLLAVGLGLLVTTAMKALTGVFTWMKVDSDIIISMVMSSNEIENRVSHVVKESKLSFYMCIILGLLGLITVVLLLFCWMSRKWKPQIVGRNIIIHKADIESNYEIKEHSLSRVLQIRREYRKFMKLYKKYGGVLKNSDTSIDVLRKSSRIFRDIVDLNIMREIYMGARYDGYAHKTDVKKIKQMNTLLKRYLRNGINKSRENILNDI